MLANNENSGFDMDELSGLFAYGKKIASSYFKRWQDIEDVAEDGALKVVKCCMNGRTIRTNAELKSLYRTAVKTAAIELLRKRFGRVGKDGLIKNPRPSEISVDRVDLDLMMGASSPSPEALQAEEKEWIDVVRHEKGNFTAIVFTWKLYGCDEQEIADELELDLETVEVLVQTAREVLERYRRKKRGWSA